MKFQNFQNDLMKGWGRVCLGSLAAAGLGAASFFTVEVLMPKAAFAYCSASAAEMVLRDIRAAGGDWDMAWRAASKHGWWDGSELCAMEIRGKYARYNGGVLPPMP